MKRWAPLLPLLCWCIASGWCGLDFGRHWDDKETRLFPLHHMIERGTLLPGYYQYGSVNTWLSMAALLPGALQASRQPDIRGALLDHVYSDSYLHRLRGVYFLVSTLGIVWIYACVLWWRESWREALLAAALLGLSWEVAYHSRWAAADGVLMSFGALTLLLAVQALRSQRPLPWLYAAAVAAALGLGTKYPGGLLVVPVLAAAYWTVGTSYWPRLCALLVVAYLVSTPGTLLERERFASDVSFQMHHYAVAGHQAYTVVPLTEHGFRMTTYLATVLFSHQPLLALVAFALSLLGAYLLGREDIPTATVVLSFPLLYLLFFSTQRVMIVRNLLVVAPFLAVLAARGATRLGWPVLLCLATLVYNAAWLGIAAESIVDRSPQRTVEEAAAYLRSHPRVTFALSPSVRKALVTAGVGEVPNLGPREQAAVLLQYASESDQWPANRRLSITWFGPCEVNFDYYPTWLANDRILAVDPAFR